MSDVNQKKHLLDKSYYLALSGNSVNLVFNKDNNDDDSDD